MKIKTNSILKSLRGKPIKIVIDANTKEQEDLTLGAALSEIVLTPHKDKNGFRPLKAYELAKKFTDQKEVDIDSSDLIQLKEVAENSGAYLPIVIAQVILLLDTVKEK